MSAAVLEAPPARSSACGRVRPAAELVGGGGRVTLEEVLSGAWEGLAAHRTVGCPVCAGPMAPRYAASGMTPIGGRCADCGSVLG